MRTHRRDFLRLSLAAGAALAARPAFGRVPASAPRGKLRMLVFGGTGFIGPKLVEHAVSRGHEVVLFNRGRTNTHLFPDLEKIVGDRDPSKGEGLKGLEGRSFDVVLDDTGYYPRHVGASARMLKEAGTKHYVFVSSVSAYADNSLPGQDEDAPLAELEDPKVETMGEQYQHYGGLKVLCERAAQQVFPESSTVIRPGYIVGPGDPTDRFTWWPVRASRGGTMLVPGKPEDPLQVIDVRDLAEWMVRVAEQRTTGVYNAVGGAQPHRWGDVIAACRKAAADPAEARWVSEAELERIGAPSFPIWAPSSGEYAGIHRVRNDRAVKAGLTFRSVDATTKDTLEWFQGLPEERKERFRAPLTPEREAELLALAKS